MIPQERALLSKMIEVVGDEVRRPCPTRDGALFACSQGFYRACSDSVATVQNASKALLLHVGVAHDSVLVTFRSDIPQPGHVQVQGRRALIEVASRLKGNPHAIGAVLAHEVCHLLLAQRGVLQAGHPIDERKVDVAACMWGLGGLLLNGLQTTEQASGSVSWHREEWFGYWPYEALVEAHVRVARALGVEKFSCRGLQPFAAQRVSAALFNQRWRAALRAVVGIGPERMRGGLPSQSVYVFSCPHCLGALRVPTGALLRVRCSHCEMRTELDCRPCVGDWASV